jgi:hypothetical protein
MALGGTQIHKVCRKQHPWLQTLNIVAKGKALLAECKTLGAQIEKVSESAKQAKARFDAKVDARHAAVVENFRGLAAYGLSTGNASAALRYLYDETKAFHAVKGDYEKRKAANKSFKAVLESVVEAMDPEGAKGQSVLDQYESIADPEAKTAFYSKHRAEIHAAHEAARPNA